MAIAQRQIEPEVSMDEHVARLEAKTDHIQSDVKTIKSDARRVEDKMDAKLDALDKKVETKYVALDTKIEAKCAALEEKIETTHAALDAKIETKYAALDTKIETKCAALETKIETKCEALEKKCTALETKVDSVKDLITTWRLETRKQQMLDKVWWLMIAGTILGVMARGMKWI